MHLFYVLKCICELITCQSLQFDFKFSQKISSSAQLVDLQIWRRILSRRINFIRTIRKWHFQGLFFWTVKWASTVIYYEIIGKAKSSDKWGINSIELPGTTSKQHIGRKREQIWRTLRNCEVVEVAQRNMNAWRQMSIFPLKFT